MKTKQIGIKSPFQIPGPVQLYRSLVYSWIIDFHTSLSRQAIEINFPGFTSAEFSKSTSLHHFLRPLLGNDNQVPTEHVLLSPTRPASISTHLQRSTVSFLRPQPLTAACNAAFRHGEVHTEPFRCTYRNSVIYPLIRFVRNFRKPSHPEFLTNLLPEPLTLLDVSSGLQSDDSVLSIMRHRVCQVTMVNE